MARQQLVSQSCLSPFMQPSRLCPVPAAYTLLPQKEPLGRCQQSSFYVLITQPLSPSGHLKETKVEKAQNSHPKCNLKKKEKALAALQGKQKSFTSQQHFSKTKSPPAWPATLETKTAKKSLLSLLLLPSTCRAKKRTPSSSVLRKDTPS